VNGIGYVGLAYLKAPGVKPVKIDNRQVNAGTVRDRSWAYARPTFFYTNGEPNGVVKQFVDFTLGDEGQKIVERVGFVGVKQTQ
jgi:phosphate transport system substrate-binding protein